MKLVGGRGDTMTIREASQCIGKSESTVRRWIRSGKLEATLINGVYDIPDKVVNAYLNDQAVDRQMEDIDQALIEQLRSEVEHLREQVKIKDKEIDELHQLLMAEKQQTRLLLEHKRPFWRRMFHRGRSGQ